MEVYFYNRTEHRGAFEGKADKVIEMERVPCIDESVIFGGNPTVYKVVDVISMISEDKQLPVVVIEKKKNANVFVIEPKKKKVSYAM